MSFPVPKGTLSLPVTQLRTMVSLSQEFQAQTNSENAADALKNIAITRVGEESRPRPFACVLLGDSHNFRMIAGGTGNLLIPDGNVGLYLTKNTNPLYKFDLDAATLDAANFFGTVIDEVVALAGEESHLSITGVTLALFGDSGDEEQHSIGDFFFAVYLMAWGGTST